MIWLALTPVFIVAAAFVARALIRDRRTELELTRQSMAAYHERRALEITAALSELGQDAERVFPARNGSTGL